MPAIIHRIEKKGKYIPCPGKELNITYSGVFDFKYFYYILHEWIAEHGFCSDDKKFREDLFSQRDDSSGREIFVKWRFEKDTKNYAYDKVELDIHMHALALGTTEVLVNNKKTKLDKGEIEVVIDGRIFMKKKLADSWFLKNPLGKKIANTKYLNSQRDQIFSEFYSEIYNLQEAIKEYFELTRYSEDRELLEYYKSRTGE